MLLLYIKWLWAFPFKGTLLLLILTIALITVLMHA
jgi:hypothetical protein